jgi:hypothetical protein
MPGFTAKSKLTAIIMFSGYRRGAQVLAEASCESRYQKNVLVHPILYLYRHTVELYLKRIIPVASQLANQELNSEEATLLNSTHSLVKLWNICKSRLKAMQENQGYEFGDNLQAGVDAYTRQSDQVDERSFSFRYATGRDGSPNLAELRQVNIVRISKLMERLCSRLEDLDESIHDRYSAEP